MDGQVGPLNEQHLADINNALQQLAEANRQIKLAKQAGIDVTAQEAEAKDTENKLRSIKQVYFPGR